ncbi:MAG: carbohydrate ABC transporter permease [Clostridiales bacterium]|jgi:multiple sugar transport system permease protein|nr:carbohydrate ABC transporter permease [Clostridiales bacterium]
MADAMAQAKYGDRLGKARGMLLGSRARRGILPAALVYIVLAGLGFVFILPVLRMVASSLMTPADQVDPKVIWVPTELYWRNIASAFRVLSYGEGFFVSVMLSVVPALLQTLCTACAGYAFARYAFPLKRLWLAMVLLFYLIPAQVLTVPRYILFLGYGIVNTPWAIYLPAIFGQGLKSSIFVLIFYQFFHGYPKSLDEAAELDGCGRFKIFWRIALPMSGPALVVSVLFSVVWYWNETAQTALFLGKSGASRLFGVGVSTLQTLPLRVATFAQRFAAEMGASTRLADAVSLAGALLAVAPMLALYLVLQKRFIESVERSGITGE